MKTSRISAALTVTLAMFAADHAFAADVPTATGGTGSGDTIVLNTYSKVWVVGDNKGPDKPLAQNTGAGLMDAAFAWDDVGDFASLATLLPGDGAVRVLGDPADVTAVDAAGVVVAGGGRRVAVVGLDDVVVVDTPDALLVTTRERAQVVKAVVDLLKAEGRTDLT